LNLQPSDQEFVRTRAWKASANVHRVYCVPCCPSSSTLSGVRVGVRAADYTRPRVPATKARGQYVRGRLRALGSGATAYRRSHASTTARRSGESVAIIARRCSALVAGGSALDVSGSCQRPPVALAAAPASWAALMASGLGRRITGRIAEGVRVGGRVVTGSARRDGPHILDGLELERVRPYDGTRDNDRHDEQDRAGELQDAVAHRRRIGKRPGRRPSEAFTVQVATCRAVGTRRGCRPGARRPRPRSPGLQARRRSRWRRSR